MHTGVLRAAGKPAGRHRHRLNTRRRDPLTISRWHIRLSDLLPLLRLAWRWAPEGTRCRLASQEEPREEPREGLVVGITQPPQPAAPKEVLAAGRHRPGPEPQATAGPPTWDGAGIVLRVPHQARTGRAGGDAGLTQHVGKERPEKEPVPLEGRWTHHFVGPLGESPQ